MKNPDIFNKQTIFLVVIITLFFNLIGITNSLAKSGDPTINIQNSKLAHIMNVYVNDQDDGFIIRGSLKSTTHKRGHIPGKVLIKVFGQGDELMFETSSRYYRKNYKSRHSSFSATVPVNLRETKRIEVTHDDELNLFGR